jgi:hypothetical protein
MCWLIKQCKKCGGDLHVEEDKFGKYVQCLQCGFLLDLSNEIKIEKVITGEKNEQQN